MSQGYEHLGSAYANRTRMTYYEKNNIKIRGTYIGTGGARTAQNITELKICLVKTGLN